MKVALVLAEAHGKREEEWAPSSGWGEEDARTHQERRAEAEAYLAALRREREEANAAHLERWLAQQRRKGTSAEVLELISRAFEEGRNADA